MLKRLELLGFKSFASRSVFEFEPGISALVGPNGSGKSNVAEAVRWALGEQSGKALRSKKAEEVIFVGSGERHPLGMAEVALVLENGDRRLPLDFTEVRLARRLYRSGESEYLVNGARVRRRDLIDLLLHVGLHTDGYTVIGQGAVEELVMQRPEERRAVLEHAADITRHQARLHEARAKLAAAEENLTRCGDLIAELEPYARRLRGQAEKAERYAARRSELAALARIYYRAALMEKGRSHENASADLAAATSECERLEREIELRDGERLSARQQLVVLEAQLGRLRTELEKLHRQRESCLAELAGGRQRAGFLEGRVEALAAEARRTTERVEQLSDAVSSSEETIGPASEAEAARELEQLDAAVEDLTAELRLARQRLDTARDGQARLASERERVQVEAELDRERRAHERELKAGIVARRASLESRLAENTAMSERIACLLEVTQASESAAAADLQAAQRARSVARAQLNRAQEEEQKLRGELQLVEAALKALQEETECGGLSTRVVAEAAGERLGSSLTVPPEFESAIAASLGEWARAEVVADPRQARAAVASVSAGRALFLSPSTNGQDHPEPAEHFDENVARALGGIPHRIASEVVRPSSNGKSKLNGNGSLPLGPLAFTVIVRDLDDASLASDRLRTALGYPWQVTTLDGQVVTYLGGWARGAESAAERLVTLRRRESEMRSRMDALRMAVEDAAARREMLGQQLSAAEVRERDAQSAESGARAESTQLTIRRSELQEERRRLEESLSELLEGQDESGPAGADSIREVRRHELNQQLAELHSQETTALQFLEVVQARWQQACAEREQARRRADLAAADRRAREEIEAARSQEIERLLGERSKISKQVEELGEALAILVGRLHEWEARAEELSAAIGEASRVLDSEASGRVAAAEASERAEAVLAELRRALSEARTAREVALLARQQTADELSRLRQEAEATAEEWGLGGEAVVQLSWLDRASTRDRQVQPGITAEEPAIDREGARRRLGALQRELRSYGQTSEAVLEEFRQVDERLQFLCGQSTDLRSTMKDLEGVIAELEGMMRRDFSAAFERVNAAFGQTFARLFGGGTAQLVLTDPDQMLRTGVDIVAQPPGKRLQSLMSLSGGERAMTSTALIFALLAINPLPFCVLDEVDAALDESNARRYAALLQEYAQRTQFIIITHNRATMEIARALYGISMGGDGVTTVVSLHPTESLAAAGNTQVEHGSESLLQTGAGR